VRPLRGCVVDELGGQKWFGVVWFGFFEHSEMVYYYSDAPDVGFGSLNRGQ
jgi:hypothetical protein